MGAFPISSPALMATLLCTLSSVWLLSDVAGAKHAGITRHYKFNVVESGGKNIEVDVMTKEGLSQIDEAEIDAIVAEIEAEKAVAEAAKKGPPRDT